MKGTKAVVGVFSYLDDTLKAVKRAQELGLEYRVFSPAPNHEIEHATMPEKSPVRFVTITGALTGLIGGFTLAIWCAMDFPLRVSAKDVVSIPAFVVIGYECTILLGAIATLLALLHFCRLPDVLRKIGFDPRFTDDKFGVVVGCGITQVDDVSKALKGAGAEEVEVRDGL